MHLYLLVPISTSISDDNSFHLCKCNLIQSPWNLSTLIFRCAFIWSTPLTCKPCSKGSIFQFVVFAVLRVVYWCVSMLTCDKTVGVVCSGLFVFVVCCKMWQTFFVFARGLNSSSGASKKFGG